MRGRSSSTADHHRWQQRCGDRRRRQGDRFSSCRRRQFHAARYPPDQLRRFARLGRCLRERAQKHNNTVENVTIDDCLFGIDLKLANDNLIRNNRISSKVRDLGVRGRRPASLVQQQQPDRGNRIIDSRDMVAWYSNDNAFIDNVGRRSRYSIHFMFAARNVVEGNRFYDNAVGVYVMYSGGGAIRNNVFSHATGATGMAIGFKEASDVTVEGNEIIYCGTGITSDISPFEPGSQLIIRNNRIAFNVVGMRFVSNREGMSSRATASRAT